MEKGVYDEPRKLTSELSGERNLKENNIYTGLWNLYVILNIGRIPELISNQSHKNFLRYVLNNIFSLKFK